MDSVRLWSLAENLGAVGRSSPPVTMTHAAVPPEERAPCRHHRQAGPPLGGMEDVEDLIADLDQALADLTQRGRRASITVSSRVSPVSVSSAGSA